MKPGILLYPFILSGVILLFFTACKKDDGNNNSTVTDIDGNTYQTVTIGTQVWMTENLKVTRFNDGTPIETITMKKSTGSWPTPRYCWYNNDSVGYNKYGALYNFRVVHQTYLVPLYIAPKGWHIPTDEEWNTLILFLGGESIAGGKLKSVGTVEGNTGLWRSPNAGATNESGYSALPGGMCDDLNSFLSYYAGYYGEWWSSRNIQYPSSYIIGSMATNVAHRSSDISYNSDFKSIRCIKDRTE